MLKFETSRTIEIVMFYALKADGSDIRDMGIPDRKL